MPTPEQQARTRIDALLEAAGWSVQDYKQSDLHAARGVAIREFELNAGFGTADYLRYVDSRAAGVIEAKKEGATLVGVETQSAKYAHGLPLSLPAWHRPLPFVYESTGLETHFTNALDPEPRARTVFAFHRPESLADLLKSGRSGFSPTSPQPAPRAGLPLVADACRSGFSPTIAQPAPITCSRTTLSSLTAWACATRGGRETCECCAAGIRMQRQLLPCAAGPP